ncbi:hypothetical protein B6U90_02830 [Thermoplasmatales archaeon ex4484_6]|nr:MAG: hypothetical protein B6U90_02830 [Thermoplasmatales archaeon ex4484_6]RLF69653.1 MAG: hypothetical protein DRN57_00090 [Thermoplasmata archaeon]
MEALGRRSRWGTTLIVRSFPDNGVRDGHRLKKAPTENRRPQPHEIGCSTSERGIQREEGPNVSNSDMMENIGKAGSPSRIQILTCFFRLSHNRITTQNDWSRRPSWEERRIDE